MVRHVFLYKVASGADPKKLSKFSTLCPKRLPGFAPGRSASIKASPGASGDLWDYALVCDFDLLAGLQKYSDDPYHMEVVKKLLPDVLRARGL